jgi:WXG100 family type VII secretion target
VFQLPTSQTQLDAGALESAAKAADNAAADVRNKGRTLVSNMMAAQPHFTGEAGNAYRNAMNELMADVNQIIRDLEDMSNNARTAANKLLQQDQDAGSNLKKVGSSGGNVKLGLS